ncbi:heme-degrading domain-containing protein [Vibrio viridaestus]|uniref:Heme-degrading domain-containing protein n=1 Tax=Vibrio viridaestus TaxID=2487322 RepID=A0A3N9TK83_9VIBR|nr:heme-degrading domain-containing protein [Vibrio viridaestus]RQW64233.1 heme-degrading domain-containing protein [Vibrio viridaestus]
MTNELDHILSQEQELQFSYFNFDTAWALGSYLVQLSKDRKLPIAIEVYAFSQVLFTCALPGSTEENLIWIRRKRKSVLRFGHSTHYLSVKNALDGIDFNAQPQIDEMEFCDHGGAFPITLKNSGIIGAVVVSGLPSHEDHALTAEGIAHIISTQQ